MGHLLQKKTATWIWWQMGARASTIGLSPGEENETDRKLSFDALGEEPNGSTDCFSKYPGLLTRWPINEGRNVRTIDISVG